MGKPVENAEVLRLALLAPFDCAQGRQDDHGFGCAHHKFLIGWPEKCWWSLTRCEGRMIPCAEPGGSSKGPRDALRGRPDGSRRQGIAVWHLADTGPRIL